MGPGLELRPQLTGLAHALTQPRGQAGLLGVRVRGRVRVGARARVKVGARVRVRSSDEG